VSRPLLVVQIIFLIGFLQKVCLKKEC